MENSRIFNSFRNGLTILVAQVVNSVLMFVCRTVFVRLLVVEYLGLNGLFSSIISILNLSEFGIGSVIILSLYTPLAQDDKTQIAKLMTFIANIYRYVGFFVLFVGLLIVPFLNSLVKTTIEIPELKLIFILYVISSASTYFYSYKRSLLIASQKEYISIINQTIFKAITYVIQIVVLLLTHNYLLYIACEIASNLASNIMISKRVDREYPYLNIIKLRFLKKETLKLYKDALAMMFYKIGSIVISSTDNIIISSFVGINSLGLYSNYYMILSVIQSYVSILFNAPSASIGNYNALNNSVKIYQMYKNIVLLSIWSYGFCSISLFTLLTPFISLWLGKSYVISRTIVFVVVMNFFLRGVFSVSGTFILTCNQFQKSKFKTLIMALLNLFMSLMLVRTYGLVGVFIGTLISYVFIDFWYDAVILYRFVFQRNLREYYFVIMKHFFVVFLVAVVTVFLSDLMESFAFKVLVCLIVPNLIMFIVYSKTKEFLYLRTTFLSLFKLKSLLKKQAFKNP